ncbi:Ankyrin repeat-containing protein [Neolecta irregularis DAH-3]|uniref:Ankyrin repeat-containing protein n=1 Tax=Neolecta irregularis (strain DAH-3) TaxID=1198029 RepID=A0A1U7LLW7_NEOID|nr:Ankyrin repeat-containing protein [Neolecta irregularis DAH-3]|eukprot:OLL23628.1 Ankyrin repeat-containing protein [Neolecta irregularis DAH-3]
MSSQGASNGERLLASCRQNNIELLQETLDKRRSLRLLNGSSDSLGRTALHIAAPYECVEILLDQEGLEVDPVDKFESMKNESTRLILGNTPLHEAVYCAKHDPETGLRIVEILLDAGADPRVKNKQQRKPIDYADYTQTELTKVLRHAELTFNMEPDVVDDGDEGEDSCSDSN